MRAVPRTEEEIRTTYEKPLSSYKTHNIPPKCRTSYTDFFLRELLEKPNPKVKVKVKVREVYKWKVKVKMNFLGRELLNATRPDSRDRWYTYDQQLCFDLHGPFLICLRQP